tara:strand:- start:352 stop:546 length:195 start_codon:yes stop_codon:yes gene_type:complete
MKTKGSSAKQLSGTTPPGPSLGVKDTDFLLKLIYKADFKGTELEQAHSTLTKVAGIHKRNLNEE